MIRNSLSAAILLLSGLYIPSAVAHHSSVVAYDMETEIVQRDVAIVQWRFTNPHGQLVFEAPDASGSIVEWAADTINVNHLRRMGYSADSFQPGQIVSVTGNPGRDGKPIMHIAEVVLSNGTVVDFEEPAPEGLLALVKHDVLSDVTTGNNRSLTGVWGFIWGALPPEARALAPGGAIFVDAYGQAPEMPIGESGNYPLTEKGRAFQGQWTRAYDECRPVSAWLGMSAPYPVEFDQPRTGRLHIRQEYMDQERTIWLDGRSHPPVDRTPRTLLGHSVGHWEGDVLVVETTHMVSNQITRNGIHHSDNAVLREWISRDGDTLTVVRVLEDPDHFTTPIAEVVRRTLVPDGELLVYGDCTVQASEGG